MQTRAAGPPCWEQSLAVVRQYRQYRGPGSTALLALWARAGSERLVVEVLMAGAGDGRCRVWLGGY